MTLRILLHEVRELVRREIDLAKGAFANQASNAVISDTSQVICMELAVDSISNVSQW